MSSLFATGGVSSSKKPYTSTSTSTPSRSLGGATGGPSSSSRLHSHHHQQQQQQQQQPRQAITSLTPDQQTEIREAFELFDLDKDSKLDYHEFKVSLRALGFDLKKAEVLKLMRERSGTGEGDNGGHSLTIGFESFLEIGERIFFSSTVV